MTTTDYSAWLLNVQSLLRQARPDVLPQDLDPNACWKAYQDGLTPQEFASQAVLPLRPRPALKQDTPLYGPALGDPDYELIRWMWSLTGVAVALYLSGVLLGSSGLYVLSLVTDLIAFIMAILLACKSTSTDKSHGWVKIILEIFALIGSLAYALSLR